MKVSFKALFLGLLVLGFVAVIGQAASLVDQGKSPAPQKYAAGTKFDLTGLSIYRTWEIGNGEVVQDVGYPAHGTLEFFEDNKFMYSFSEDRPSGNSGAFFGKLDASGTLKFEFPAPLFVDPVTGPFYITDLIRAHTCGTIWGPGINEGTVKFNGRFDGEHFSATAGFMAMVASPCPTNDMFDPALHPGPLHWIFNYELDVAH